jgi:uncharacterized protein YukE
MSATLDQVADELAHTYGAIERALRESKTSLERTRADVELVCRMDPGLLASLQQDLASATHTLDGLSDAAATAGNALRQYAEAIRSGGA